MILFVEVDEIENISEGWLHFTSVRYIPILKWLVSREGDEGETSSLYRRNRIN